MAGLLWTGLDRRAQHAGVPFTPRDPSFRTKVEAIFAGAAFVRALGIRATVIEPGEVESVLALRPDHLQQDDVVHAGVQTTIADHTAGAAAGSLVEADQTILTVELKINLLERAVGDSLRCRAVVLRAGRTITVAESDVFARNGSEERRVARATVTLAVVSLASLARRGS